MHWQTTLVTRHLNTVMPALRFGVFPLVSSGVIALPERTLGFSQGVLVRDPDGHVVQLITP
jgi:hypothetical protein